MLPLFFVATRWFHREPPGSDYDRQVEGFFQRMNTPVDFEREVGGDNTAAQARIIGSTACIYGSFVLMLTLIPNPLSGRLGILACATTLLGVGAGLPSYARRLRLRAAAVPASSEGATAPAAP